MFPIRTVQRLNLFNCRNTFPGRHGPRYIGRILSGRDGETEEEKWDANEKKAFDASDCFVRMVVLRTRLQCTGETPSFNTTKNNNKKSPVGSVCLVRLLH